MKPILLAIGAALLASRSALAFDGADLVLDSFGAPPALADSDARQLRVGGLHRGAPSVETRRWASGPWRDRYGYRPSSPSVTDIRLYGGAVEAGSFYGTAGTGSSPSVVVIGALPGYETEQTGLMHPDGGAGILDVAADRLDRRPYGDDGIDVVRVGTAKIIRIAPDFGLARERSDRADEAEDETPFAELSPAEQAVTVYPDPDAAPAPRVAERPADSVPASPRPAEAAPPQTRSGFLEPWTPDWLRDCVARYPSFDASLGTYVDEAGLRRFCTGEPSN